MMEQRLKAESWSNIRSHRVKIEVTGSSFEPNDITINMHAHNIASDIEDNVQVDTEDKEWDQEPLSYKSFSFSTLAQRSAAVKPVPISADTTPRTRRKSVKRIIEKFSASSITDPLTTEKNNVTTNKKTHKAAPKRDSVYFNLYMDAIEQRLFDEEDMIVWTVQERFPNDDLKFYEGLFSIQNVTSQSTIPYSIPSPSLSPRSNPINVLVDLNHKHTEDPEKHEDTIDGEKFHFSAQLARKKEIAMAKIHDSRTFKFNHHHHHQHSNFASQFPVFSRLSPGLQAKFKKMAQRRQSAPSIVIRGVLGRSNKLPASLYNARDELPTSPYSPNVNSQRLSLKFGSHDATLNLSKRKYVMEGKVQLTTGMQTQDRYMFLFTDLLLIAKAKSGNNFKLKYRIRVCELWIASCIDDVTEVAKSPEKSFVIGWPTENFVATFSSPESKELWLNALLNKIREEKEKESPKTTDVKVINRDSSNTAHVRMVTVSHKQTAKDVAQLALKEFNIENEDDYQLWVTPRKEGTAYPLIGHELPHAIQLSLIRDLISANGILPETEITSVARYENEMQQDVRNRCQFILRSKRMPSNKFNNIDMTQRRLVRLKAKTGFLNWTRKRNGQRNESSDSGHASLSGNSAGSDVTTYFSSSPPSTSPPASPKLFSLPLGQVCTNGELPTPIADMLDILYRKAPYTTGIFRKSANAKTTRQLKHKLDEEADVTISDASIYVIAALVKDFLRNIPNSVLDNTLYTDWTNAIEEADDEAKLGSLRRLLRSLDQCNRVLIRRLSIILNRIASRAKRNNMTSYNLAICIAPSLLWPPGPAVMTEAPMKVTEILMFLTDRCGEVFDGIVPTDLDWPPEIESEGEEDDEYEGDIEKYSSTIDECLTPGSDIAPSRGNEEEKVENEEDESDVNHFSRSRVIRRQLQRRKPGSKAEAARLLSLSQDSLDRVLNEDSLTSNSHDMDDLLLNQEDLHQKNNKTKRRGQHRGTDACSMSNDSGFTTLSGEDEDLASSYYNNPSRRTPKDSHFLLSSSSAGSNLNDFTETLEENIRITSEELKRLWSPNLLRISNGEILEGDEFDSDSFKHGEILEEDPDDSPQRFREFARRQSQPVLSRRHRLHASSVGSKHSYRLPEATASPCIEYTESNDEINVPFRKQPPTYVRLNDDKDGQNSEVKEDNVAKEYLRQLRKLSTDDVTKTISKSMTSQQQENENKKQYLSGVTVTVNDVRSNKPQQFRPVTLSLRGISEPAKSPPPRDATSATSDRNIFFIGDQPRNISPIDEPLNSSHEDVFSKNYEYTPARNRTASLVDECPKTAPVRRKFNSVRGQGGKKLELNFPLTPEYGDIPTEQCLSPIQKLTENLNMLPDFRQHTTKNCNGTTDMNGFSGRKKASSVREGRNAPKHNYESHYFKTRSNLKPRDVISGASIKPSSSTTSKSSISSASKSSIESNSRSSLKDISFSQPTEDNTFERDTRTRKPHGRKRNISSKMYRNTEEGTFSKSLPSADWKGMKDRTSPIEKRESSRESVRSLNSNSSDVIYGDVISRLHQVSPKLKETDIIHMAGAVESKIRELSSSPVEEKKETTSTPQFQVRLGSVKSKINTFNHMNSSTNPSPVSHSSNSSDDSRHRNISSPSPVAVAKVEVVSVQRACDVPKKKQENDNRNGLVVRTTPESGMKTPPRYPTRIKDSISVQVQQPEKNEKQSHADKLSQRRSPQAVSDNLIFSLSESFAFGNRKTPRSITPSGSPKDSPVFMRRRRTDSRTARQTSGSPSDKSATPFRQTRHMSVERCSSHNPNRTNVHVMPWSAKRKSGDANLTSERTNEHRRSLKGHRKPPISPVSPQRDNNSNEILPFMGLEKVIHSEESYV
ncbi:uncharacterized protein LOC120338538 isoform X1 [Styela clava]